MKISMIVAMAQNGAIGLNNQMPWHLSADLKQFKKITMGKPIVMGRKTHESIGRVLPGRENIIISRNPDYQVPGCTVYPNIESALVACAKQYEEVMIIGGSSLYQACLPRTERLYLTLIYQDFPADTWFPDYSNQAWREIDRIDINDDPSVSFKYSFITLERIPA